MLASELRAAELAARVPLPPPPQPWRAPPRGDALSRGGEWERPRLEQELQAALALASNAQRAAAEAEEMAAQQQASFAMTLQRERERLRAAEQASAVQHWGRVADAQLAALTTTTSGAAALASC